MSRFIDLERVEDALPARGVSIALDCIVAVVEGSDTERCYVYTLDGVCSHCKGSRREVLAKITRSTRGRRKP